MTVFSPLSFDIPEPEEMVPSERFVGPINGLAGSMRNSEQTSLAQFRLGCWYSEPPADANRTPDQRRAFKWLYRAAEAGNAPAQFCTTLFAAFTPWCFQLIRRAGAQVLETTSCSASQAF